MQRWPIGKMFAELQERWGMFPNQSTLGSYDYFTQSVRLDSVRPDHWHSLEGQPFGALETSQGLKKFVPVSQHEYAHWLDMNCTLYGLRIMRELSLSYQFNPYLHKDAWNKEGEFFHARRVADSIKQIRLPNYYSLTFESDARQPWKYQISVGHGFDATGKPNSDPIIFLRFSDALGEPIARQPLSMSSILEANATYNEMLGIITANFLIQNADERLIEEKLDNQKLVEQVYDPKLTLYSVAAHLCAATGHMTNIAAAYKAAAILSRFVLNIPRSRLIGFNVKDAFVAQVGRDIAARIEKAIRLGNVESLFFYAATIFDWDSTDLDNNEADLAALSELCFDTDLEKLRALVDSEAQTIAESIRNTRFPDSEVLAVASVENCAQLIRCQDAGYRFGSLHLPPCFMANDEVMSVTPPNDNNRLANLPITDRFYALSDNEFWIRKFSEACYPKHDMFD